MKPQHLKMTLLSCFVLFFLNSCEVETIHPATPPPAANPTDQELKPETPEDSTKTDQKLEIIGTGSG